MLRFRLPHFSEKKTSVYKRPFLFSGAFFLGYHLIGMTGVRGDEKIGRLAPAGALSTSRENSNSAVEATDAAAAAEAVSEGCEIFAPA